MTDQLAALIDQHLAHRNPADRLCRDQLIASIEQLFAQKGGTNV